MESSKKYLQEIISLLEEKVIRNVFDATYLTSGNCFKEMSVVQKSREKYGFTSYLRSKSAKSPESRYDLEYLLRGEIYYGQGENSPIDEETHYWFFSPILKESILNQIFSSGTDWDGDYIKKEVHLCTQEKIIDIGCGNGTLIKKLIELGIPKENLFGVDISETAVRRVNELGTRAFKGPIQNLHWEQKSIDIAFLSYFVVRVCDQKATFETTARILDEGGLLILEGLFPCVLSDSSGISYGEPNVTKGLDPVEDILYVVEECKRLNLILEKIIVGQRLVYSLDGPETLPTYILIFQKDYTGGFGSH